MRIPTSTYRLQVQQDFDLFDVADVAEYVRRLGADWLYLSPLLHAGAGSDHGYDVVEHDHVDHARGGAAGLAALQEVAQRTGAGVLVDIVPNHVSVADATANAWWCDVLTSGQASRYAEAFDIDWAAGGGRVRLAVLGDEPDPQLELDDGVLRYHDRTFPLAPGTADDDADPSAVHARQHYELVNWRRADAESNYRRFFAISSLAAVRVEVPWVFEETHRLFVRWRRAGIIDGLRIDHIDGLADPGAYLDELADLADDCYIVVEKILEGDEQLPPGWVTRNTTGYEALALIDRVLVDPDGEGPLDALDAELAAPSPALGWTELTHTTKRGVTDGILRSEVLRIERELGGSGTDGRLSPTADAVAELLACFPVYRSYLPFGVEHLDHAVGAATAWRPDLAQTIAAVAGVLADPQHPAAVRFQQTSGMVMAKGVEDCAFYRYNRLGSLTEVGGDPSEFAVSVDEFHRRQQHRLADAPAALTALTTHDTKRGEDVRARLSVLAEVPAEWRRTVHRLHRSAPLPDGSFEQLVWQAVVGAWPISRERLLAYAEKAAREAGASTSWSDPDEEFEAAVRRLVDAVFDDERVGAELQSILALVTAAGHSNALAAKLIQVTCPGAPDVYQGSELWERSLVDPDNRRPVDFAERARLLDELDAGHLPEIDETGAAKLLVTSRALRLRRDRPELFTSYAPVTGAGPAADHVVAFDRGGAVTVATRLPIGLDRRGGWGDTTLAVGPAPVVDVLTGCAHGSGRLRLADLLRHYPVALLVDAS